MDKLPQFCLFLRGFKGLTCFRVFVECHDKKIHIDRVYVAPDCDYAGMKDQIIEACKFYNIPYILEPFTANDNDNEKFAFAAGWGHLIDIKSFKDLYVIHDSFLPDLRGFSPVVNSIRFNFNRLGATIFRAVSEVDAGPIVFQVCEPSVRGFKVDKAFQRVRVMYENITKLFIDNFKENLFFLPQNERAVSYSVWRDEIDFMIDWSLPAEEIVRHIDSVGYPYAGALTFYGNEFLRVFDAEVYVSGVLYGVVPGKIFKLEDGCPVVMTGNGCVKLLEFSNSSDKSIMLKTRFTND